MLELVYFLFEKFFALFMLLDTIKFFGTFSLLHAFILCFLVSAVFMFLRLKGGKK